MAHLLKFSENSLYRWYRGGKPSTKNAEIISGLEEYLKYVSKGDPRAEKIRKKFGWSLNDMAQCLKISPATLRRWEHGDVPTLRRTACRSYLTEYIQFIAKITKRLSHYNKHNRR